eukprot:6653-Heterococcus_DN1.PRE.2
MHAASCNYKVAFNIVLRCNMKRKCWRVKGICSGDAAAEQQQQQQPHRARSRLSAEPSFKF